jgi:hypothetical protein
VDEADHNRALSRRARLADGGLALGLMALGLAIRVWCWSGVGLGDDSIFIFSIASLVANSALGPGNLTYRFTWWLPTAVATQLLGEGELAMVLPYLVYAVLGIGLVYAFGRRLWGRSGGVIAGLLLAVHPLDVTWSTMITNDIALSFFSALTIFALVRAIGDEDPAGRRRWWIASGVSLFLSYHSKVSGLGLVPAMAAICLTHRRRLAGGRAFLGTVALLFGAGAVVAFAMTGSVLGPVHAEMSFQGLVGAPESRQVGLGDMLFFPQVLFYRDHLGDLLNAFYPHVLLGFVVLGWPLGLRTEGALWWWFLAVFLGMELNVERVGGYWVTGFRNYRHAHIFVYPLILLLAGYLVSLRAKLPRVAAACCAVLVGTAFVQALSAATKTQVSFGDCRAACRFLSTVPPAPMYLDDTLRMRCTMLGAAGAAAREWTIQTLPSDPVQRAAMLRGAEAGYVVTGGGREPIYGGAGVVVLASELPADRVELVNERGGPVNAAWRVEPLRIWKLRRAGAAGAP